jgi:pimeloyl-ACP methyl ester carboxylesterase
MVGVPLDVFDRQRRTLSTASGPVSYIDTGDAGSSAALFIHGVGTSSYLWRNVIDLVGADRRCVAVDLPLHGETPARPGQDFSLGALARFVAGFCDALGLAEIDLVANDTGGAVAQIFAAGNPHRLRTFTLTNCETHRNVPPPAFLPTVLLARARLLAPAAPWLLRDIRRARKLIYGPGYQDIDRLSDELARRWLAPQSASRTAAREFQRWLASLRPRDLLAVEPQLRRLHVPTQIVWGTGDRFFHRKWAYWLRDTIPGATGVVEVPGAKLFFPDERPEALAPVLRRHWQDAAETQRSVP